VSGPIDATDFDPAAGWPSVVEAVQAKNRILGHFIAEARVPGVQGGMLVLEVEPNGRALLEHKDNRPLLLAALAAAYGRKLDYRVASTSAAAPPAPPRPAAAPSPAPRAKPAEGPPAGFEDADDPGPVAEAAPRTGTPSTGTPGAPTTAPPTAPAGRRKQPGDLSPGARSALVWLEGEIVGPPRPPQ
jgi:hypothetical protein